MKESIMKHAHKELGHFGVYKSYNFFKANIGGKACIWKFNYLFHDAQRVIRFMHHFMHPPLICNSTQSWGLDTNEV